MQEELRYEPETGYFYWIKAKTGRPKDRPAGYTTHQGYRNIRIGPHLFVAHRLAFLFMTGEWPPDYVGFKDNNPLNLRWDNLVLKSKAEVYDYVKTRLKCNYDENKEQEKRKSSIVTQRARFQEEDVQKALEDFLLKRADE